MVEDRGTWYLSLEAANRAVRRKEESIRAKDARIKRLRLVLSHIEANYPHHDTGRQAHKALNEDEHGVIDA